MASKEPTAEDIVFEVLTQSGGLNRDDINLDDSLSEDLHINASTMTNIIEMLEQRKITLKPEQVTDISTVSDLVDLVDSIKEI